MKNESKENFQEFIAQNRRKMNHYMAYILLFCTFAGPAIALDAYIGLCDVSYLSCTLISIFLLVFAIIQQLLNKRFPDSIVTVFWGLVAFLVQLTFMCMVNVSVKITLFLVPLVSLYYCDKRIYTTSCILGYVMCSISTWLISGYWSSLSVDLNTPASWFVGNMCGYTIEFLAMSVAGYFLCSRIVEHYRRLYDSSVVIEEKKEDESEQHSALCALAGDYTCVIHINLLADKMRIVYSNGMFDVLFKKTDRTNTTFGRVAAVIAEDPCLAQVQQFMDLDTLRTRLNGIDNVSIEFNSRLQGRCRGCFVPLNRDADGNFDTVLFTLKHLE